MYLKVWQITPIGMCNFNHHYALHKLLSSLYYIILMNTFTNVKVMSSLLSWLDAWAVDQIFTDTLI